MKAQITPSNCTKATVKAPDFATKENLKAAPVFSHSKEPTCGDQTGALLDKEVQAWQAAVRIEVRLVAIQLACGVIYPQRVAAALWNLSVGSDLLENASPIFG